MPVFNVEKTIKAAILSVFQQTYQDWELIIVDDGSNDKTPSILSSINDERVIVITQRNHGRGYARNVALQHCSGEYIAFLDGDDMINRERLEKQVSFLENNKDYSLVSSAMIMYGYKDYLYRSKAICGETRNFSDVNCATAMLRRSKSSSIYYDITMNCGEDLDFLRRYINNDRMYVMDDALYYYNISDLTKCKLIRYSLNILKSSHVKRIHQKIRIYIVFIVHILYYLAFPLSYIYSRRYPALISTSEISTFESHKKLLELL